MTAPMIFLTTTLLLGDNATPETNQLPPRTAQILKAIILQSYMISMDLALTSQSSHHQNLSYIDSLVEQYVETNNLTSPQHIAEIRANAQLRYLQRVYPMIASANDDNRTPLIALLQNPRSSYAIVPYKPKEDLGPYDPRKDPQLESLFGTAVFTNPYSRDSLTTQTLATFKDFTYSVLDAQSDTLDVRISPQALAKTEMSTEQLKEYLSWAAQTTRLSGENAEEIWTYIREDPNLSDKAWEAIAEIITETKSREKATQTALDEEDLKNEIKISEFFKITDPDSRYLNIFSPTNTPEILLKKLAQRLNKQAKGHPPAINLFTLAQYISAIEVRDHQFPDYLR